ncbi:MAG: hypothetical protein RMJ82_15670, partial [Gemmatales bacterium]|nr:hypothetical protein [Gemmatales bacterium]
SQGVVSMFTFGYSFGGIVGCCETLEIPILFIQPTIWKKVLFPEKWKEKLQKSDIIAYCQTRFGSKIPKHDGIADAICIALCGIEKICNKKI